MPGGSNNQALLEMTVSYEWIINKKTSLEYLDNKLESQLKSVSASLQAWQKCEDHRIGLFFSGAETKLLRSVACMAATLTKLFYLQ